MKKQRDKVQVQVGSTKALQAKATIGKSKQKKQKKKWRGKGRKDKQTESSSAEGKQTDQKVATVVSMPSRDKPTNSNWALMKAALSGDGGKAKKKRRGAREDRKNDADAVAKDEKFSPLAKRENRQETRIVALDCEMVGVGESGHKSVLARVVVVNYYGNVLVDSFCRSKERVTDYRTRVSGIRATDLKGAPDFEQVQKQVATLLRGKVVVGHALKNDFKALKIKHPKQDLRDTASYAPLRSDAQVQGLNSGGDLTSSQPAAPEKGIKFKSRALKELAAEHLGLEIQHGEHSPVEDARAALYLYHKHRIQWERSLNAQTSWKKKLIKNVASAANGGESARAAANTKDGKAKNKRKEIEDEEESEGYGVGLLSSE